jgi:hypothetical protein
MPHSLTSDGGASYFHTTLFTGDAFEANILIFSAVTLPIFGWTEDRLAE